jgi:transposase-like protein
VADTAPCPNCHTDAFVRAEQVISGRRVYQAYYCGRCGDAWQVESTHAPERRQAERRERVDEVAGGRKKPARAELESRPERRKRR